MKTALSLPGPGSQPLQAESAFQFDNVQRNLSLDAAGLKAPKTISTGTTIVGSIFKDGVVIGADSRATEGNIIADKNCNKLHKLTEVMYAAGAGTAADLDQVTRMIGGQLELQELYTGRRARVISALRHAKQYLFRYMGYVGAYLLIGGVDDTGPVIYEVHAHGSSAQNPYAADGSGSLNAMAVLESEWHKDMDKEEAIALVRKALEAGMHGDNSSGNSLRYAVITQAGTEMVANVRPDFTKSAPVAPIKPTGQTKVLQETLLPVIQAKIAAKKVQVVEEMEM